MKSFSENIDRLPAIILCGGNSRRMGRNKAQLPLGQHTVLEHVEQRFSQFASPLIVVISHDHPGEGPNTDSIVIRDENRDFGPLEGLRVGLTYCQRQLDDGADCVYIGTCDAPLILPAAYRLMHRQLGEFEGIAPRIGQQLYPLTAVYRMSILTTVQAMVDARQLKVRDLFKRIRSTTLSESEMRSVDPQLATIQNINTLDDYRRLQKMTNGK